MEYVEGETLRDFFARRGKLPPSEALPLLRQIAAGLEALQAQKLSIET
jgi:serine/threonine protein kinase